MSTRQPKIYSKRYRSHMTYRLIRQVYAGFAGGLCMMIVGVCLGWPSQFLLKLQEGIIPFNLTSWQKASIVAWMDFGNVISAIPGGYLMDYIGRKRTYFAIAIIFQIAWLLVIFANGAILLLVARILAGIGKGIGFTVVPMYLAEIAEVKMRGALSTIFTILLYFGTLFEFAVGPYVSYTSLNWISATIPLVFFVLVLEIPESPYYLLMKNDYDRARESIFWLRNCRSLQIENFPRQMNIDTELQMLNEQVQKEMKSRGRWWDLVGTSGTLRATSIVMPLNIFQRFGGISCMLAYTTITLPPTGGGLGPEQYMVLFGLILTLANFVCLPLIDRLGRRPLLLISTLMLAILQGATAIFYHLESVPGFDTKRIRWIPYVNLLLFAFGYSLGIGIVPSTLLGEMFPANVRGKAAAVASIVFAFSSFCNNNMYLFVSEHYGVKTMFIIFAVMNFLAMLFIYFFVIETKGKTLLQIQVLLNSETFFPVQRS